MQEPEPSTRLRIAVCLGAINLLTNFAVETSNVFIALYARDIGATDLEIGLMTAAAGTTFFASSFIFGRLSDIHGRMAFIRLGLGITALAYLTQLFAHSPLALLLARATIGFALGISSAVLMAYTYENQRHIGSFISYGSLGWLLGAVSAAIIKEYTAIFIASAIVASGAFLVSFFLTERATHHMEVARLPLGLLRADYRIYLGFFLRQLGGNAIWAVWALYQASIGATKLWIALTEVTNMVGQIIAMRHVEKFNPARMFQGGLLLSALVFASYGLINRYWQIIPAQVFLSIAYSSMFVGALSYLLRHHPEYGTTSGLLNSVNAISGIFGPFLGGGLAQALGYPSLMFTSAAISLASFLATWGLKVKKTAGGNGEV